MARKLFTVFDFETATLDQNTTVVQNRPFGVRLRSQDPYFHTHAYPAAGAVYTDYADAPISKGSFSINNGESGGASVTGADDKYGNVIGSTQSTQSLGTGNGILVTFSGTLAGAPVGRGTILVAVNPSGAGGGYDDGEGALTGPAVSTGTINYTTGAISVTLLVAPTGAQNVDITYRKSIGTVDYDDKNWLVTFTADVTAGLVVTVQYKSIRIAAGGEYREGIVVLPTWTADSIAELFGFQTQEEHVYTTENGGKIQLTDIRYQLSVDGGVSWLHWGGTAWTAATLQDAHWDNWEIVDANISNLKFLTTAGAPQSVRKSITVRVRMTPAYAADDSTVYDIAPVLRSVSILHELAYEFEEDLLRSLKRYFDTNVRVLLKQEFKAQSAASSWTLVVHEAQSVSSTPAVSFVQPAFTTDWAAESELVAGKVWLYNLTDDPLRTRPLKASIVEATGVVTKDAAVSTQTGSVEVWFYASVPTYIGADERLNVATSRALIVHISESFPVPDMASESLYGEVEPEYSKLRARLRVPSQVYETTITVRCQSPSLLEASSMVSAVQRLIAERKNCTSVATGQPYIFQDFGYPQGETAGSLGLATESFHVVVQGTRFYPSYQLQYLTLEAVSSLATVDFKTSLGNVVTTQADL